MSTSHDGGPAGDAAEDLAMEVSGPSTDARPLDGAGGGMATDGSAPDADVVERCIGGCLSMFLAPCARPGQSCVSSTGAESSVSCYANGVKVVTVQSGNTITSTDYAASGQTCYSTIKQGVTEEDIEAADGTELAHITFDETQTQLTIECYPAGPSGPVETTAADLSSAACAGYVVSIGQTCAAGNCSR
jgi:hypothetical protein